MAAILSSRQTFLPEAIPEVKYTRKASRLFVHSFWSGEHQRKHQNSASLALVWGIHSWSVDSPLKGPVTRKCFHLVTSSWNNETYFATKTGIYCQNWVVRIGKVWSVGASKLNFRSHTFSVSNRSCLQDDIPICIAFWTLVSLVN